jgi:hypothetical protein
LCPGSAPVITGLGKWAPADASRVALMMLARRGRLEIGYVLKVLAPN